MSEWQPIKTQTLLNKRVRIKTAAGREFDAIAGWYGMDSKGNDCCAWAAYNDWEAPACWTDGICWDVNESGAKSDQPVLWRPLEGANKSDTSDIPKDKATTGENAVVANSLENQ